MPIEDRKGDARDAFENAEGEKPRPDAIASQKIRHEADGRVTDVTREAVGEAPAEPPSTAVPTLVPRPDGATVQAVHTAIENEKRAQVSPPLTDNPAPADFKKKMLVRREFNRAARDPLDRSR